MFLTLLIQTSIGKTVSVETTSLANVYIALGGTIFASILAALASLRASYKASETAREVAELTARTAQDVKEREYRNDYYKKILDKRIQAIEYADAFSALFLPVKWKGDKKYNSIFLEEDNRDKYLELSRKIINSTLWYNEETFQALRIFNKDITKILPESNRIKNLDERIIFCLSKYDSIEEKRMNIKNCLANDLKTLHKIDDFFISRSSGRH